MNSASPALSGSRQQPWVTAVGNLAAQVHETHTGVVVLIGDSAFKAKKPLVTDFLDFSTADLREQACLREVELNRRMAADSYLGVGHFSAPQGGPAEPVVVMRRYPDSARLSALAARGEPIDGPLAVIAEMLARFHRDAARDIAIDDQASVGATSARWRENLSELRLYVDDVVGREALDEITRLAIQFLDGRADLFAQRIAERRIVDGHGDLMSQDIFCMPEGPVVLDCLEFDDRLRYVDGIDDAAFLAMDLEFLGRKDAADFFLDEYARLAGDTAPNSLRDFCIAYRAVVRAKVDCIRVRQGHREAVDDARRHLDVAARHLRSATVRLIIISGGPGTGKTTIAHGLAKQVDAQVISTDEVRRELQESGALAGRAGDLDAGLYAPENVSLVYDEVLRRARCGLACGRTVILDGTWRDAGHRERAHRLGAETLSPVVDFTCSVPLREAVQRIRARGPSASDATPKIAAALGEPTAKTPGSHPIDTARPLADSVAEAQRICCLAI
ncbi:AAA family ATPase [Mycolicibacterium moriokaense]|nr:AAA family ATPase [Mycolicibacterium moriokaense]